MIAEPIQGAGGFATVPDGFFQKTKGVLDEYGIHLVSDEVQSGWGRTGRDFFGMHAHGVIPEVFTFAKGLANGVSIGGVVASEKLMHSIEGNSISTAGGNPIAMAAANATLDYVLDNDLQLNAAARGAELMDGLKQLAIKNPAIGEVRGEGLMIGVELVVPHTKTPDAAYTLHVLEKARQLGLLIGRGGSLWQRPSGHTSDERNEVRMFYFPQNS